MTYSSKKTIASVFGGILLVIAYIIYGFSAWAPAGDDLQGWAIALLIFISAGIVVSIVIQILFNIGASIGIAIQQRDRDDKEVERDIERVIKSSDLEDEMYKLISMKALRVSFVIVSAGFMVTLGLFALGFSPVFGLNVLAAAFFVGSIAEGIMKVYLNERGV
ncbi:hypothetical protein [Culicoidibacter larvae]|uniref:Uncharacterized protein n=1 Tax=Culicoidibacter larvae TaxID=2579976 RepID=A0A5R8QI55_9FIRM|nr:hypothetical protein [Culicoidibacter larvae]TLG77370.1 hypothetical protein FEZ08_01755 [Culicoidibacter larvae]